MEGIFLNVLNMSVAASYVIAAVLVIRLLLRKAPKKWSYLLWSVVAFRLCCPVSLQSAISLFNLQPVTPNSNQFSGGVTAMEYIPPYPFLAFQANPSVNLGLPQVNEAVNGSLPAAAPMNSANPIQIWIFIGAVLWCAGMGVIALYSIISYVRLRRRLNTAVLLEGSVWQSEHIRSPFILGLFRPKIYIPYGLDGDTLGYVLEHERHHIRRRDYLVKAFAFLLLTVHWFNPLCWLAFHLMGRDMEMSCDEKVLETEENIRKAYSTTLLSFAAGRRFPSPSPLAFGESSVKSRIKNALGWKKPKLWATLAAAALCITAVAACAANPTARPDDAALRTPVSAPTTPNTMRPAVMYGGRLYYSTGKATKLVVDYAYYMGTIQSTVAGTQLPERDGEANFDCLGTTFAKIIDGDDQPILVWIGDEWVLFEAEESDAPAVPFQRTPFTGIMGYDGYLDEVSYTGGIYGSFFYFAQTEDGVLPIGESFSLRREDYVVDLDGDGITELVCNYRSVTVFRNRDGVIERGWLDWDAPDDFANWGANASWTEYDPDQALFLVHYDTDEGGNKTLEYRGMDSFVFEPYQPSEEALNHLKQTDGSPS